MGKKGLEGFSPYICNKMMLVWSVIFMTFFATLISATFNQANCSSKSKKADSKTFDNVIHELKGQTSDVESFNSEYKNLFDSTKPPSDPHSQFKITVGKATWTLLHTLAAKYPEKPSIIRQSMTKLWLDLLPEVYPCEECATHMRENMARCPPVTTSRDALEDWICCFHNLVNDQLNKTWSQDCKQWKDYWRSQTDCKESCSVIPS